MIAYPAAVKEQAACAIRRCRLLSACTEKDGETTRTFLCEAMHQVHRLVKGWMEDAGMQVRVDAAGNMRGVAGSPDSPRLLVVSHLDTVPGAGAFDGVLGVMLGIAMAEAVQEQRLHLPFSIEVIGFSEEEGVRFRTPFLGSRAVAGDLGAKDMSLTDGNGITLKQAIGDFGLDPDKIPDARLHPEIFACIEIHIEQGPVLEALDAPLGVVTDLVGQTRMEFIFHGQANHAGTTPMHLRRDALAACAEWMLRIEEMAGGWDRLVATVGRLEAQPGIGNVIPGRVTASLDLRHPEDGQRARAVVSAREAAEKAASTRGVTTECRVIVEQAAVRLDGRLSDQLARAAARAGYSAPSITSGAGHDAMVLAPHVPTGMLFLRTPGGLSHHRDEAVLEGDVAAALLTAAEFVRALGKDLDV